uniref:Uncharacterized protein n=1 Tax=Romanomermis culicivorax TaxID=13658 RepID=A0A915HTD0_ROMCU
MVQIEIFVANFGVPGPIITGRHTIIELKNYIFEPPASTRNSPCSIFQKTIFETSKVQFGKINHSYCRQEACESDRKFAKKYSYRSQASVSLLDMALPTWKRLSQFEKSHVIFLDEKFMCEGCHLTKAMWLLFHVLLSTNVVLLPMPAIWYPYKIYKPVAVIRCQNDARATVSVASHPRTMYDEHEQNHD